MCKVFSDHKAQFCRQIKFTGYEKFNLVLLIEKKETTKACAHGQ
jgi:hypothetical protein